MCVQGALGTLCCPGLITQGLITVPTAPQANAIAALGPTCAASCLHSAWTPSTPVAALPNKNCPLPSKPHTHTHLCRQLLAQRLDAVEGRVRRHVQRGARLLALKQPLRDDAPHLCRVCNRV